MTQAAFDDWVEVLKTHFPTHPLIADLGTGFVPCLPEEAAAHQAEHCRRHPVAEMKDQDGARRADPTLKDVIDWIDMMRVGDLLLLRRRDGGELRLTRSQSAYAARCVAATGAISAEAAELSLDAIQRLSEKYLKGDAAGC